MIRPVTHCMVWPGLDDNGRKASRQWDVVDKKPTFSCWLWPILRQCRSLWRNDEDLCTMMRSLATNPMHVMIPVPCAKLAQSLRTTHSATQCCKVKERDQQGMPCLHMAWDKGTLLRYVSKTKGGTKEACTHEDRAMQRHLA